MSDSRFTATALGAIRQARDFVAGGVNGEIQASLQQLAEKAAANEE